MILLLTSSDRAGECATALQVSTGKTVHVANTLPDALGLLRSNEYIAVVFDQCLLDPDPEQGELLMQHLGPAVPVYVNCALCGIDRLVRDVSVALTRRETEIRKARRIAEEQLRSELREPLTALLLNCDLLLESPGLLPAVRDKILVVDEMARQLSTHLEVTEEITTKA